MLQLLLKRTWLKLLFLVFQAASAPALPQSSLALPIPPFQLQFLWVASSPSAGLERLMRLRAGISWWSKQRISATLRLTKA